MIRFIKNTGEYFASNYFDEDFASKVLSKTGYNSEDVKEFNKKISPLKDKYFRFKQTFIEGRLRNKDKVYETHQFHTQLLNALGFEGEKNSYNDLFHLTELDVIPVRHTLYRGDRPHLMIMEMQALIKEDDIDPDGLFEQRYNIEEEEVTNPPQKYHRSQWERVFQVPPSVRLSPSIIKDAIFNLFTLEQHYRPKYILLLAGNIIYLLEEEKWKRGSYLEFDIEELFSEATANRSANYYALFYFLIGKETLAPDSNMVLLDQLDEDSHKSAYEVTKDLKEGIIHAVEALANEALFYQKNKLNEEFDETDDVFEQQMKDDCLRIIYRLLFIFYAESREDLDILPSNDPIYNKGYSLEMLRDLEQVPLYSENSRDGYFFHDSISKLFSVLSSGYREKENGNNESFKVRHIDSPIFDDRKLHHLHKVKFRNKVWQDIICRLSLSREQKGKTRGRISYANLGINQLGSVYESLLAFRGFYAEQDYIEVHKKGKPEEGTYLVPRHRRDDFEDGEILKDEKHQDVIIKKGTFVYRLSGRDRQKSASYYTPEVLTQSTVKYTLKPFVEKLDSGEMKALELLELKLLEPAMGAAAFHNEMINQLAETYINYRQKELRDSGRKEWKIEPDKFKEELQKVKAYIATHNVYGVDLNPTAIELGKLSLWLNVIHKDMETPFFSNRICVGNAVVGAWLKVYPDKELLADLDAKGSPIKKQSKKEWWEKAPRQISFVPSKNYSKISIDRKQNEVYHFLLPDKNMLASAGIKLLKAEHETESKKVADWKKEWTKPLFPSELERVKKISNTIDELLTEYYKFQRTVNAQTASKSTVFGFNELTDDGQSKLLLQNYDEKERLADQRNRHSSPYYKIKMVMDYWCSLWFWDMRDAVELPERHQYWSDIESILGIDTNKALEGIIERRGQQTIFESNPQLSLAMESSQHVDSQEAELSFVDVALEYTNRKDLYDNNLRLSLVHSLAAKYAFFHPQLEFLEVFWERGGFDLIAGNPPWIKIAFDKSSLLSDYEPIIQLRSLSSSDIDEELETFFSKYSNLKELFILEEIQFESFKQFFNSLNNYKFSSNGKSNLFKLVLENCICLSNGYTGLVVDEGLFDDTNGGDFRKSLYYKMQYHFRFNNELKLFAEVGNAKKYEVIILSPDKDKIEFSSICNLFHPRTIDISFTTIDNKVYSIRDENDNWELKGNLDRVIQIDSSTLKFIQNIFEPENEDFETIKLPLIHNFNLLNTMVKTGNTESRLKDVKNVFSTQMINETNGQIEGIMTRVGQYVEKNEFIFSGPHYYVATPFNKTPNENCNSHRDYTKINLSEIDSNYLPRTVFKLLKQDSDFIPKKYYHIHRRRAMNTNERTLIGCIAPPNIPHTNSSLSLHFGNTKDLLSFSIYSNSIIYDFIVRTTGNSDMWFSTIENLPFFKNPNPYIINRGLRLNCINYLYADLWNESFEFIPTEDSLCQNPFGKKKLTLSNEWNFDIPFKTDFERRQALLEIDVLVAMELNMTLKELITLYEIQFPVLRKYDSKNTFNSKGFLDSDVSNELFRFNKIDDYVSAWGYFEDLLKNKNYGSDNI